APEPAPSPAPQVAVEPQPASIAPVNSPAKIQALLAGAPEPLQLHFVRQLEAHPADAKRPVLKAFLGRAGEVHPGALLESVLQVKRCGAAGSRDLVELYATVSPERQRVILQAFEVLRDPSDRQALAGLKLSPTDPLAPRWASLRKG
ncbi:MAG TPA: hypothetical protein DEA08_05255, partial [Planctomycetes bacterium]|nr:hypothetical protein [Planctomycetota bacterium]